MQFYYYHENQVLFWTLWRARDILAAFEKVDEA
jgi:hypothetical protein